MAQVRLKLQTRSYSNQSAFCSFFVFNVKVFIYGTCHI